ncbi:uncharacterized protein [Montipora foliosa]|uniref:uncharacterized protein isoform X2 n=1 Tax=Montipora foliosa TaxID=591990 RepID=UPI0035F1856E
MESQLDKLGRKLKSDEYWTSTTIYRPSRRNQRMKTLEDLTTVPGYHKNKMKGMVTFHASVKRSRRDNIPISSYIKGLGFIFHASLIKTRKSST